MIVVDFILALIVVGLVVIVVHLFIGVKAAIERDVEKERQRLRTLLAEEAEKPSVEPPPWGTPRPGGRR